jgi:hypothetical protein
MIAGSKVRPQKWTNVLDLFDDSEYSAIWGTYANSSRRSLGVRWNGNANDPNDIGFPQQGGNPLWYIEPQFVSEPILQTLLTITIQQSEHPHQDTKNLKIALEELRKP